ncbi:FAD-dependent oxidoreductase [Escherichia coli]
MSATLLPVDRRQSHALRQQGNRRQNLLEPEGLTSNEIYPNGISTSLPFDVQCEIVRSAGDGKHGRSCIRVMPLSMTSSILALKPTLESGTFQGLFFAGQINGTTGSRSRCARFAGRSDAAVCLLTKKVGLRHVLGVSGILVDDLCTLGTKEPYRMFTSRADLV